MSKVIFYTLYLLSLLTLNVFKKKTINSNIQDFHKGSSTKLGGFVIIFFSFFILRNYFSYFNILLIYLIPLIGFLADIKVFNNPKLRFTFQIIFLFLLTIIFKGYLINIFNFLINYFPFNFFGYLFFIFLFISISSILINGTNFIDGYNGLLTIIFIAQLIVYYILLDNSIIIFLVGIFLIYLYFNFFHNIFLGDCGAYFIAILNIIFSLIAFYIDKGNFMSIILINIYPFFETIFSFIRKIKFGRSPFKPDGDHLHMLIFYYLSKRLKIQSSSINSLTGLTISLIYSFFILSIFFIADNSITKLIWTLFFISIYMLFYFYLYNLKLRKQ